MIKVWHWWRMWVFLRYCMLQWPLLCQFDWIPSWRLRLSYFIQYLCVTYKQGIVTPSKSVEKTLFFGWWFFFSFSVLLTFLTQFRHSFQYLFDNRSEKAAAPSALWEKSASEVTRGRSNLCFINNAEPHRELIKEPSRHIASTTRIVDKDESFLIFQFSQPHHDGTGFSFLFFFSFRIYLFVSITHQESLACTLRETSCCACAIKSNSTKAELSLKFS